MSAKVRYGPVQLVLDVPDGDVLLAGAANPHKQQVASVVFFDANGGQPVETLRLPAAYCIRYHEQFSSSDVSGGAYQCVLTLSDPAGWTIQAGGPARAFVAPAARSYAGVAGAGAVGIGGAMRAGAAPAPDAHAAAWAAARARAITQERKDTMYAAYVADRQRRKKAIRQQAGWWGVVGKKGGALFTVEGGLGEEQADQLFAAQGHKKLNHGGALVDALDPPKGKGIDGVWKNAAPPPVYLITETKFTLTPGKEPKLPGGQLGDEWTKGGDRLEKALGINEGIEMRKAMRNSGTVGRRLLHVDSDGYLHEYDVDKMGKFDLSKPLKKLKV